MLINADVLMDWIMSERVCSIEGALRSNKTSLAFYLATRLILNKNNNFRYIISNCSSDITDQITDVIPRDGKYLDTIIIFDELGKFVDQKNSFVATSIMADLGKLNVVMLNPSRNPTYREIRKLVVEPISQLQTVGIDGVLYRAWLDRRDSKNKTKFLWLNTQEIKGYYSSDQIIDDSEGIINWLIESKETIKITGKELETKKKVTYHL